MKVTLDVVAVVVIGVIVGGGATVGLNPVIFLVIFDTESVKCPNGIFTSL